MIKQNKMAATTLVDHDREPDQGGGRPVTKWPGAVHPSPVQWGSTRRPRIWLHEIWPVADACHWPGRPFGAEQSGAPIALAAPLAKSHHESSAQWASTMLILHDVPRLVTGSTGGLRDIPSSQLHRKQP